MEAPKFIKEIDFELLRNQKSTLLELVFDGKSLTKEQADKLEGIIGLLDGLQDYAVETGIDENIVFEFIDDL